MTPRLLLAVLVASIHGHPTSISPGKYSLTRVLDYFWLSLSEEAEVRINYHGHSLRSEDSSFLPSGELLQFGLRRDDQGHLRGAHHAGKPCVFKAVNETHLLEVRGDKSLLWEREAAEVKSQLVEIAVIQNPNHRSDEFIREAFSPSRAVPPVYYWDGVYSVSECPTTEIQGLGTYHNASKLIGITMAHLRVWQEFYRRHRDGDHRRRILIFEADIHCAFEFCGDLALEHIDRSDRDVLYVGWCRIIDPSHPPYCAHAYSISVRAAKILIDNVFPCLSPVDTQLSNLGDSGILTWAAVEVDTREDMVKWHTAGLILQNDW